MKLMLVFIFIFATKTQSELCNELLNDLLNKAKDLETDLLARVQDYEKLLEDILNIPKAEYSGRIIKSHPLHLTPLGTVIQIEDFCSKIRLEKPSCKIFSSKKFPATFWLV